VPYALTCHQRTPKAPAGRAAVRRHRPPAMPAWLI